LKNPFKVDRPLSLFYTGFYTNPEKKVKYVKNEKRKSKLSKSRLIFRK